MQYSKKVLEHFTRPKNQGEIENPDAVSTVGNPKCGDIMKMYLKIEKNEKGEEYIKDIKFQTLGCGAAIATSSMGTELAKGKTLKEALKITNQNVADELGGLPQQKMHCSNLAAEAIHKAIMSYQDKK
ncbi:MAG: iron-sulfur cluster assembly scaffold protein [Candidatus Moranbacteria bacterium]|nr:iron-sulfur cluster assembly scaffold protein [Candidatus Moranbacteria bacterium]